MNRMLALILGFIVFGAIFAPRPGSQPDAAIETDPVKVRTVTRSDVPVGGSTISDAMVLRRDASGQFHIGARVNGTDTRFLVDTGADVVALTPDDAAAIGINPAESDFQPIMRTASGVGYGAPVMIERIELGETTFRNVEGVVVRDLGVSLLGQSVLRRLGKVELRGDRMVLSAQ
jgi:aspartyl protease family protein